MVAYTIRNPGVPIGEYLATFVEAEEREHKQYGPGLLFKFKVLEGEFAGRETGRVTGVDPTPKNICGRMLGWLAGVKPTEDMQIDPDDFVGERYRIIVDEAKSGDSTRVERVIRVNPDGSSQPAEPAEPPAKKETAVADKADGGDFADQDVLF